MIEQLQSDGYEFKRTVVFFRRIEDLREVYSIIFHKFQNSQYNHYTNRPFAMFQSTTDEDIRKFIIKSFSDEHGTVRLLLATIAFGMGVNCRALNNVIHFGPPSSLEDYFQETGRIGRDGTQSHALLLLFPGCMRSKNISKEVKDMQKTLINVEDQCF